MGGREGKVLFGTIIGRVVAGSSRGWIGNTIVGAGFDGSFVPCAEAASKTMKTQKLTVKNSIDARIVSPSISGQRVNATRRIEFQRPAGPSANPHLSIKARNQAITQITYLADDGGMIWNRQCVCRCTAEIIRSGVLDSQTLRMSLWFGEAHDLRKHMKWGRLHLLRVGCVVDPNELQSNS